MSATFCVSGTRVAEPEEASRAGAQGHAPCTLVELFERRVTLSGDALAYSFVRDDLHVVAALSYAQLNVSARTLAGWLSRRTARGSRVLLVYAPGLEFVRAFWACVIAGMVPVPVSSPDPARLKSALSRLRAIGKDADASLVLTEPLLVNLAASAGSIDIDQWFATEAIEEEGQTFASIDVAGSDVSYLQYTSGSTSSPRGVMITHANALANCAGLTAACIPDADSRLLSWLPHFHDYGLVHGILWPFFAGMPAYLMSPLTFLRRPLRWLEAIDRFDISFSGAPNFAYASCVQALARQPQWKGQLDTWKVASCGAEPINAATVSSFVSAFAAHDLRPNAFAPAYGLAEATLLACTKPHGEAVTLLQVDAVQLSAGRVLTVPRGTTGSRCLVSSGVPVEGITLHVVDVETQGPVSSNEIGEIWLAGSSVGAGYWGKAEETTRSFGLTLAGTQGLAFFRTGDLGFVHEDQVYVTGRLKDMLIIHGRNVYPQDVEWTVERAHTGLRAGYGAVVSTQGDDGELLVVVQEVERRAQDGDLALVAAAIRKAVAEEHDLSVHAIALVRSGTIPRTTSGKVRRKSCRTEFLDRSLSLLHLDVDALVEARTLTDTPQRARDFPSAEPEGRSGCEQKVVDIVSRLTKRRPQDIDLDASAIENGLDSLKSFSLLNELEATLGLVLPVATVLTQPSLRALARRVDSLLESPLPAGLAGAPGSEAGAKPGGLAAAGLPPSALSVQQEGVWLADRIGENGMYNLARAASFDGPLDLGAFEHGLRTLIEQHDMLRVAFEECDGRPVPVVRAEVDFALSVDLMAGIDPAARPAHAVRELEALARRPFDLGQSPLMRVAIYRINPARHIVVIVLHHLVFDGWSASIMLRQLAALYQARVAGVPVSPPESAPQNALPYSTFVARQHRWLASPEAATHLDYWRQQLRDLPALAFPTDRPRPARPSFEGAVLNFELPADLLERLKQLAAEHDVTLFMVLLGAFQTLLLRFANQEDFAVGSPTAGRLASGFAGTLGLFTNTLVLRADLAGNPSFVELLARVRRGAVEAFEHQALPADQLAAELGHERDLSRNALFQVGLALQNMGNTDLRLPGLTSTPLPVHTGTARTDLWLNLTEAAECLQGEFEYATDLFEATTVARLAGHFRTLLTAIVADPRRRILSLALLDANQREQILEGWNSTRRDYPLQWCMHELFEQQAARSPHAIALRLDAQTLTYSELNQRANRLARHLRALGVGPDRLVGVCLQRSLDLPLAMLAVMKAGGAFVALDPNYPPERLALMLVDAAAPVVLTHEKLRPLFAPGAAPGPSHDTTVLALDAQTALWSSNAADDLPALASPEHAAYVIFTSGSTGQPKGVLVTHRGMCNHKHWELECLRLDPSHRVLHKASISFDASIFELFAALLVGASVVLARPGEHGDIHYLARTIREHGVTHLVLTPSAGRALLSEPTLARCASLRHLLFGGEALPNELVREFRRILPGVRIGNFYGPSETTEDATHHEVEDSPAGNGWVSIGRPIANMRCHVLDVNLEPVPVGVVGELYIGGFGLARGYLNRPELTAERFVADPFRPGERLYRSGDLASQASDGQLYFVGRADTQLKIRGYRIEPAEVESALRQCSGVQDSVVLAQTSAAGDRQLVAYVVGDNADVRALRQALLERLPAHMVPTIIVPLDAFPLLPNGKLDRHALPLPEAPARDAEVVVPRSELEHKLWQIWRDVLRVSVLGVHDNFFELGGHSLIATQVVARVRSLLQVELPLRAIFEAPTIAGLARAVEAAAGASKTHPVKAPITARPRNDTLALSFSQRRMWVIQQMDPGGTAYNMPFASRLKGRIDPAALHATVAFLVARHEAFRTSFEVAGDEPVQRIAAEAQVAIEEIDLRPLGSELHDTETRRLLRERALRPFDLARDPLLRITLIRRSDTDHVLLFLMHHAVGDQWSGGILAREIGLVYQAVLAGRTPALEPLRIQYADYAAWQREQLGGQALDGQLTYWRARLDSMSPLALPTDAPRPARPSSSGANLSVAIPPMTVDGLRRLSAAQGVTVFMALLAVFKLLLSRYSGQGDIAIGTPIANRTRTDTEDLVGTMVNTLVLRTDLSGDPSFTALLQRVRDTALQAYAHQDLPYERLVDELRRAGAVDSAPLIQVLFNVPNAPWARPAFPGLELEPFEFDRGSTQFDLSVTVDTEYFQRIHFEYSSELYRAETVARLADHYLQLLDAVIAQPAQPVSSLRMLMPDEYRRAVHDWNHTELALPAAGRVSELISGFALTTPHAVAVGMGGHTLTCLQLEQRSNQLANHLRGLGLGRSSLIGVCLERSPELLVALLAVMKCGAAYVPLDPAFPRERLQFMVEDAELALLLTHSALRERLMLDSTASLDLDRLGAALALEPDTAPHVATGADDLAYVLYTSGSTGRPKGVDISHRALINFLVSMQHEPGCTSGDTLLSVTTLSFDISGLEFYLPLTVGARVELAAQHEVNDAHALLERMAACRPSLMQATPATWGMLIEAGWSGDPKLVVLCGGEALSSALAARLLPRCKVLWNMYGPTETTIWSTLQRIESPTEISIGRPIANTTVYVLDRAMQPVPVGVPGEIYIGGRGVAQGYHLRPDLTEERFVRDPFSGVAGARLYRTGDLARYLIDGRIVHLGRSDHQVKIRGYRVEPGEIEAVLASHALVAQCVVAARDDRAGMTHLVAYVVPHPGMAWDTTDMRNHLSSRLPEYMTPAHFVRLSGLPLTANYKVDINALPAPGFERNESAAAALTEPRGTMAVQLTALWRSVLDNDAIGVHDNFFEHGGHSLKAVRLLSMIERVYGRRLPLATLIEAPTVAQMEEMLSRANWIPPWRSLVAISLRGAKAPLFAVPGVGGNVLVFAKLAALLARDRPVYGLQAKGLDGVEQPFTSIEEMAELYVSEIRSVKPHGPYLVGGTCTGGVVAYEMARSLRAQGETVALVIMESWHPSSYRSVPSPGAGLDKLRFLVGKLLADVRALARLPARQWLAFVRRRFEQATVLLDRGLTETLAASTYHSESVVRSTLKAVAAYRPSRYPGRLLNLVATRRPLEPGTEDTRRSWEGLATETSQAVFLPAEDSGRLFISPHVEALALHLEGFAERELGAQ